MKIMYVITQGECGGAQKNVFDISVTMKNKAHDIFVCTGNEKNVKDKWLFNHLRAYGFKDDRLFVFDDLVREISPIKDLLFLYKIFKFIKKNKFDLVHLHSTKAGVFGSIAAKCAGAKVVYTVHGFVFTENISFLKKFIYIFMEKTASFFRDLTITVSEFDKKMGKRFGLLSLKKTKVIYNGINKECAKDIYTKEFSRDYLLSKIESNIKVKFFVGVIANLYKNKGIDNLIDTVKLMKDRGDFNDMVFFVVGEGDERFFLENKVKVNSLKNKFFLLGSIPDAYKYLRAFDLIVLPSIKEGFPYILIESILAGVPFVATAVGGVPELVKYSNGGVIVPKNNIDALANAIINALSKHNINNIYLPEKFSLELMVNKIEAEYKKLVK